MSRLVRGRVSKGSDFYTFDIIFFYTFESTVCLSKAHFVCLVACCLLLFMKAVCLFLKKKIEHTVTYISIHTIQLIFLIQIATIFSQFFFLFWGFA